jgi:hypothetical protein
VFPFLTVPTATLHVCVEVVREQYEPELGLDMLPSRDHVVLVIALAIFETMPEPV